MSTVVPTAWEQVVHVYLAPEGIDVEALTPGRDLVLDLPRGLGDRLPHGVLLDDLLAPDTRGALDREAIESLAAWRRRRDAELTVDGICLPHIWEHELLAEVFLPETRIASGLQRLLVATTPPRRIELHSLDRERAACLRAVLASSNIEVGSPAAPADPPRYPSAATVPSRLPLSIRVGRSVLGVTGVPERVRGHVYLLPYWNLRPVVERLATDPDLRLVLDPRCLPPAAPRTILRCALRGGWVGYPGRVARRRSQRRVAAALAAARAGTAPPGPLAGLLDARALTALEQRAGDTPAIVARMQSGLAARSLELAVLPYDSQPDARAIVHAARATGVPTLVIQHGFFNEPNEADKTLTDAVAVWSERDVRDLQARTPAQVVRTGNPGVSQPRRLVDHDLRAPPRGHTLFLVEYSSRLSTRIDSRASIQSVNAALAALAAARPQTVVTIRPHPSEHELEIFSGRGSLHPELEVRVDAASAIGELIDRADLCIGPVSTATLEAGAAGVPTIFLNITGSRARWPFDGTAGVPAATSPDELARLIPEVLARETVAGRQAMIEALGADPDSVDRVLSLIRTLAGKGQPDASTTS